LCRYKHLFKNFNIQLMYATNRSGSRCAREGQPQYWPEPQFLQPDAMQARPMPSCGVSVCLFVTFVHSVETNKCIFIFFTVEWPHHSTFSIPNVMAIFQREPPPTNGGVECRWVGRNRDSLPIYLASLHAVNRSSGKCNTLSCDGPWRVYNTNRW